MGHEERQLRDQLSTLQMLWDTAEEEQLRQDLTEQIENVRSQLLV